MVADDEIWTTASQKRHWYHETTITPHTPNQRATEMDGSHSPSSLPLANERTTASFKEHASFGEHSLNAAGLPSLNVDLRAHKLAIAIPWIVLFCTSCIMPIAGYYALHYGVPDLDDEVALAPWTGLFGVASLYSLATRTWRLVRNTNDCRPLGQTSVAGLDFFGWNFVFGFVVLTVIIALGCEWGSLVLSALPLSVLVLYVCLELLLAPVGMALGVRAPFRFSSVARGDVLKPGVYVIVEDVVAVDGNQGRAFRVAFRARYEASAVMRAHLRRMDLLWGATGLMAVAVVFGVVFGVEDKLVGYGVGWALPWAWAGAMALISFRLGAGVLEKERAMQRGARGQV